jgi:hypothetical protein
MRMRGEAMASKTEVDGIAIHKNQTPPSTEMVERLARAIAAALCGHEDPTHEEFCDAAIAVLWSCASRQTECWWLDCRPAMKAIYPPQNA